ncbi:hypothetical protein [Wolbachia endosymbiont of Trichogramma kaykai]
MQVIAPFLVIPVSSTGMTPFAVQFTCKNECSYSCVLDAKIHYTP